MADHQGLSAAKLPRHARGMLSLLAEDTSTTFDSAITADTNSGRYVHSHGVDGGYEEFARITGFDVDFTDCDDLTFPGFRPMRHYLKSEPAYYLVSERRWSNHGDSRDTIGQKNVIIIFVCIATIEECLVDGQSEDLLPVATPFNDLMALLFMVDRPEGLKRTYRFLNSIRLAFVNSRTEEIKHHLANGKRLPPEPSNLSGLGRMLLDVMDRHIAFLRTKEPLTRFCVPMPLNKLLKLRLIQVKNQLRNKESIEECFKTFVPTIPADKQIPWPRGGMATAWQAAQAKLIADQSNTAADSETSKHPEQCQPSSPGELKDANDPPSVDPVFNIPGIPADGPTLSSQSTPTSTAGHSDALSGLQIFKTAACQVHRAIKDSRGSTDFRNFIGQIENDVEQFQAAMETGPALTTGGPGSATGILGSELKVLLERRHIRSLMRIGLHLIRHEQCDEACLTHNCRQMIMVDVMEELRKIKAAADQIGSVGA